MFTNHQRVLELPVSNHRSHKKKLALPLWSSKHKRVNKVIFPRASVHPKALMIQFMALCITVYNAYKGHIY